MSCPGCGREGSYVNFRALSPLGQETRVCAFCTATGSYLRNDNGFWDLTPDAGCR